MYQTCPDDAQNMSTQKSAQKLVQKLIQKLDQKLAQKLGQKLTQKLVQKLAQKSVQKLAQKSAQKLAQKLVQKLAQKSVQKLVSRAYQILSTIYQASIKPIIRFLGGGAYHYFLGSTTPDRHGSCAAVICCWQVSCTRKKHDQKSDAHAARNRTRP